jgi:VWFA-related protein
MNNQTLSPAETQRRKADNLNLKSSFARARSRSLSTLRYRFAPLRLCGKLFLATLLLGMALMACTITVVAQQPEDIIRVQTRVVFLDALVKDKRTGTPISDLKLENFQVYDDGKPRSISYFTREGQARKPLALVIILDCREDGAGRFLKRPEILKSMVDELAKLPPGDEVAIVAMNIHGEDEKRVWLTDFTRDRAQLEAALAKVPSFVELPQDVVDARAAKEKEMAAEREKTVEQAQKEKKQSRDGGSMSITTSTTPVPAAAEATPEDVMETETIKGKNGAVIVRTTKKDGTVSVTRTSANGKMVINMNDVYDMAAAVRDSSRHVSDQRPNSQAAIVWVSDGIAPIFFEDRDATEKILIKDNVIFNSLTVDLRTLFKFLMPLGRPVAGWMGISLYGSAKRLAQQSGGEAVRVNRTSDYGSGLAKVIGNLTARYSLGFTLAEQEKDDGRLHNLEVRVKAEDTKGKTRRLLVNSRQGYYMPTETKETSASRAQ